MKVDTETERERERETERERERERFLVEQRFALQTSRLLPHHGSA